MKRMIGLAATAAILLATGAAWSWTEPIVVGHEEVLAFDSISSECIGEAKARFFVTYGHTSHGSQIVTGMQVLMDMDALYSFFNDYDYYAYGDPNPVAPEGNLSFWDYTPSGDLGNPDRTTWESLTRTMLSNGDGDFTIYPHLRNLVMWSWCGEAGEAATEEDITTYLDLMNGLESSYPDIVFVYMTGHLEGTGVDGAINQHNNQIRDYCRANNKVLFDFADIESYNPDGAYFLDRGANDACDYDDGNWAQEWCAANSDSELCTDCGGCAHSECLNCNRKGRAFWWMLAKLTGCLEPGPDPADDVEPPPDTSETTPETTTDTGENPAETPPDTSVDTTTDTAPPDTGLDTQEEGEEGGGGGCGCSIVA
jgi:hypothetical protein